MNTYFKVAILIIIIIVIGTASYLFLNQDSEPNLNFSNISVDDNGCGNLTENDIVVELERNDIKISTIKGIEQIEIGNCKIFSFRTESGYNVAITDKGIVSYEKN